MVPNRFPTLHSNKRIAIIGESPGKDEESSGQPFFGASGRFLAALLSRAGISREACYLGNVSMHRPFDNDISLLNWNGDEIQHGLYQLKKDVEQFKPNIIVLLGNTALKAAKDCGTAHILKPNSFKFKNNKWRGSLFKCDDIISPFNGHKCMASYHPAFCLRDQSAAPFLQFDLRKAIRESESPLLNLPERLLEVNLSEAEIIGRLRDLRANTKKVGNDIEGYVDSMSCISFAESSVRAFIVPLRNASPEVWLELALTLEDPNVHKVYQNGLYDRFILQFCYGIRVQGNTDDIMIKHWHIYSELAKDDKTMSDSDTGTTHKRTRGKGGMSLAIQASLWTDEPYWKFEGGSEDIDTFHRYCCKDSAVTHECCGQQENAFNREGEWRVARTEAESQLIKKHYKFNIGMLNVLLYMEIRGIKYDIQGSSDRHFLLKNKLHASQAKFNALTGHCFPWKDLNEIKQYAFGKFLVKKGDRPYKKYEDAIVRFNKCMQQPNPDLATIGEVEDLCEVSLNVDSKTQFQSFLYETLKLPTQYTQPKNKEEAPKPTADYEALLNLSRWCNQNNKPEAFQIVQSAIEIRALGTRAQMLSISADKDARIRCGYNLVGSNTGRITCYESPTGSGYNLQTIPNYTSVAEAPGGVLGDRDLFLADEGHWLFQCDLSGADGWTVAAYSAMLGDPTMLDDYKAGISPFKILTLMLRGKDVSHDRSELAQQVKIIGKDDWDRFACKRVQHGGSYLEGGLTISRNILKDSEGKLYMTPTECDKLKNFFFTRYWGVRKWHDWVARRLAERPVLTAASGQVRQFFGRPDEILTKAVAFEPQANTTYATNLAAWKLWTDNENRTTQLSDTGANDATKIRLRIEPLHQIHDALVGQFKKDEVHWAAPRIKTYFANEITIAGIPITIPYEGGYGRSWGQLDQGKL